MPASVRIGSSSPAQCPGSAVGRAPGCQPGGPWLRGQSPRPSARCCAPSCMAAPCRANPRRGASSLHLGVAQMAARVIWDHEAAGSRPATETSIKRVLGCGRSSMEEPWAVNPLVPVRLRPVTPKHTQILASRPRAAEQRPHEAKAGGSFPPRTTRFIHEPRRCAMKRFEDDACLHDDEQTPPRFPVRDGGQAR